MYAPAPPRPKKTNIVRSRSGCKCCRERRTKVRLLSLARFHRLTMTNMREKKKCDEKKPTCGTCARLGKICEPVKPKLEFRVMTTKPETEKHHNDRDRGMSVIPNLVLTHSLQHTEREIFYSAYWQDHCLPALHPVFRSAAQLIEGFPALKDAVLALSSCNLSRTNAERKSLIVNNCMGAYSPNVTHQTRSQRYYSSAIHRFTKFGQSEWQHNFITVLTILVLFTYIESTRGNFEGYKCHVRGLRVLLDHEFSSTNKTSKDNSLVRNLLTAWMQPQFQVWWARSYFSTLDVQQQQPRIVLPDILLQQAQSTSLYERRTAVLSIMCESHRLNMTTTLGYFNGSVPHVQNIKRCCQLLAEEAEKLDRWVLCLPVSEQPLNNNNNNNKAFDNVSRTSIEPLFFESHDASLNYAYYAIARIMQCTTFLHLLNDPQQYQQRYEVEVEPWIRLLLRILLGVDKRACTRQNNYTIGLSGLVLAALLRCQDLASGLCLESWLRTLRDIQPTEEGSFPVYQAHAVARAINHQRMVGRDVFAVSLPVDDGGGCPKFRSYNNQIIDRLLIHGRCRTTGGLFTDCIRIVWP